MFFQPAVLDRPYDVEADGAEGADQEDDEQLVEEGRVERRNDEGVARLKRATHAGHGLVLSLWLRGGPDVVHFSGDYRCDSA